MDSDEGFYEREFELECQLCFRKYEPEKIKPKTLRCGHKVCLVCYNGVLKVLQNCPICKVRQKPSSERTANQNSLSTGSYCDASSQSKKEILDEIPTSSSSVSKCEMPNLEIPKESSESKMEIPGLEIPTIDTTSKSIKEVVSQEIRKVASVRPKRKIFNMENPRDTSSETKGELLNNKLPTRDTKLEPKKEMVNIEIPTDTSLKNEWERLSSHINSQESKIETPQKSHQTQTQSLVGKTEALELEALQILQDLNKSSKTDEHDTEERRRNMNKYKQDFYNKCFKFIGELENRNALLFSCYNKQITPRLTLDSFSSTEGFINEIIFELYMGKDMYAVNLEWYCTAVYWGKITFDDGKLYIHSFSNELPDYPPHYVLLSDLKKCMTINNFRTFIDIEEYHLICTMLTSSPQTLRFIHLCSGEDGESYRGLNAKVTLLEKDFSGVVVVEKDLTNIEEDTYKFLHSLPSKAKEIHEDKLVVVKDGICEILRDSNIPQTEEGEYSDEVIASVSSFNKKFSYSSLTPVTSVKNCGLIITILVCKMSPF